MIQWQRAGGGRSHTCEEGSFLTLCSVLKGLGKPPCISRAWVFLVFVFLFGLEITVVQLFLAFVLGLDILYLSLGEGARTTTHCMSGPSSSHVLFFLAMISSPLFFSFNYTMKLA